MGGEANITIFVAFVAGLLSFISPCVLPLVPTYVSYLGGRAVQQASMEMTAVGLGTISSATVRKNRLGTLLHGLFFVGGFTVFFVVFGLLTNASLNLLGATIYGFKQFLPHLGGLIMIVFGLHVMGVTGWILKTLVNRVAWDKLGGFGKAAHGGLERIQVLLYGGVNWYVDPRNPYGLAGSALMGIVLAAAWTPCIGAIFGAIIGMSLDGSWTQAGVLMFAYSIGLGVPFLLTAVALDRIRGLLKAVQRQMRLIEAVAGVFLIVMGLMLITDQLATLSQSTGAFADFTFNLDDCTTGVLSGTIASKDFGLCMQIGPGKLQAQNLPSTTNNTQPTQSSKPEPLVGLDLGYRAPAFTTQLLDGRQVSLESLRGKVVLLNFWATWCGPCRSEMPYFQTLADRYGPGGFAILAVNYQEKQQTVAKYVDSLHVNYPIGLDVSGKISSLYQAEQLPVSYLIAPDGTILARQFGQFNTQALEASLDKWIDTSF